MTTPRWTAFDPLRVPSRPPRGAAVVLGAAVSVLLLFAPGVAAWSAGTGVPSSWSNGMVLCRFDPLAPSAAVSALSLASSGVTLGLLSVSEAGPGGSVGATTNLTGLAWTVANWSEEGAYDLAYSLDAPLTSPSSPSSTIGWTNLTVQFVLPTYQGSPFGPTDVVNVVFWVDNWTWRHSGDHLVLSFSAGPTFPAAEHLNETSAPGWLLASSSNTTGGVLERVGVGSNGTVATGSGPESTVVATPSLTLASPSYAQVSVAFASSAGAFTSLSYSARVGVVLPATVAGIPLSEIAAAGAAGVVVSLMVAVIARRIRRRPSRLIYVTEKEEQQ